MKVVSLFSGCGGLDYGLHQAGHEIILQCENDPGAQQVLKAAFPGTLLVPDIVALAALPPDTELLAAGFPCIDVSRAGLRRGLDGPSTGLVRHVFRLLERAAADHRPVPWVLLENVEALPEWRQVEALLDRRQDGPPVVAWLAQRFERLGYKSWAHRVVCSAGFGVPNRRKRVFMVAAMHGDARDVLLAQGAHRCMGACLASHGADCWECFDPDDVKRGAQSALGGCSYALDLGNARSAAGVDVVPTFTTSNDRMCLLLSSGKFGLLRIQDAERLQGLPDGHTLACVPGGCAATDGGAAGAAASDKASREAERRRFQLLGNAVTSQVARWVGERLAAPYRFKYLPTDADTPLPEQYQAEGLDSGAMDDVTELRLDRRLGSGAVSGQGLLRSRSGAAAANGNGTASNGAVANGSGNDASASGAAASGNGGSGAAASGSNGGSGESGGEEPEGGDAGPGGDNGGPGGDAGGPAGDDEDGGAPLPFQEALQSLRRTARAASAPRHERYQATGSLAAASWPKAAWYVEGQGRWGVAEMSECPLKLAFVPLGQFIREVGARPSDVSMVTYLQRLKEQGWDVTRTERKLAMCAGDDAKEIMRVIHKGDVPLEQCAAIGHLAWATEKPLPAAWAADAAAPSASAGAPAGASGDAGAAAGLVPCGTGPWAPLGIALLSSRRAAAGPWWPVEVVDPWRPPAGFLFLVNHAHSLDEHERRAFMPAAVVQGVAKGQVWSAADAAGFGPPPPSPRKLLVLWLGVGRFEWRWDWELLPFEPFADEMEGQARRLDAAGKLSRRLQFYRGLQDAREALALLKGRPPPGGAMPTPEADAALAAALEAASRGGGETLRDAAAARAARQAHAANSLPRCQVCEACTQVTGATHRRRCLVMRAAAAAAGGHAGAQLAVMGEGAVGARVSVWWPIDGQWFGGLITAYDRLRVRHTVRYDDGDVEILPLWGPQQRIRLTNKPQEWAAEAARIAAAREEDAGRRAARQQREATNLLLAGAPTTALEAQRAANIARNNEKLRALGLNQKEAPEPDTPADAPPAPGTPAAAAAAAAAGAAPASGAAVAGGTGSKKRSRGGKKGASPASAAAPGAPDDDGQGAGAAAAADGGDGAADEDAGGSPAPRSRSATPAPPAPAPAGDDGGAAAAKRRKAAGEPPVAAAAAAAKLPPRPPGGRAKGRAR